MRQSATPGAAQYSPSWRRLAGATLGSSALTVGMCLAQGAPLARSSLPEGMELWGASPQAPVDPRPNTPPVTLDNQTIREVVRLSAAGTRLRVRLTNEYTGTPTVIGEVRVAVSQAHGAASSGIVPGTDHPVTFGGQTSSTLAPNAAALSDPIDIPVSPLLSLAVSVYVSKGTAPTTLHAVGQQTAYIVAGDQASALSLAAGSPTTQSRYLLSGIDAVQQRGGATIVTLGDSITDGFRSSIDGNRRWPDVLAERLQQTSLRNLSVANGGIAGNRLLSNGTGPNALSRLDGDVLSKPGVRFVTLLEGINDIGLGDFGIGASPSPADIIAAYRQIIARVHERGALIFGCTLTPYKGAAYYTDAGEQTRAVVNEFIRNGGAFDGVIDFDQAIRDPNDPLRLLPAYDSRDHLHPNDDGYAAMANAVPLRLFRQ